MLTVRQSHDIQPPKRIWIGDEVTPKSWTRNFWGATMIRDGLQNKEIADRLCLSVRTVENHRRSLYQKLGVGNSAELIKIIGQYLQ